MCNLSCSGLHRRDLRSDCRVRTSDAELDAPLLKILEAENVSASSPEVTDVDQLTSSGLPELKERKPFKPRTLKAEPQSQGQVPRVRQSW